MGKVRCEVIDKIKELLGIKQLQKDIEKLQKDTSLIGWYKEKVDEQQKLINFIFEHGDFNEDNILDEYKYSKLKDVPRFVKDIFYKKYSAINIESYFESYFEYVFVYYKDNEIGTTLCCLGELIDKINKIDNK